MNRSRKDKRWAWRDAWMSPGSGLSKAARHVLHAVLAHPTTYTGLSTIPVAWLVQVTGYSDKHVRRAVNEALSRGWLHRVANAGTASSFRLTDPTPDVSTLLRSDRGDSPSVTRVETETPVIATGGTPPVCPPSPVIQGEGVRSPRPTHHLYKIQGRQEDKGARNDSGDTNPPKRIRLTEAARLLVEHYPHWVSEDGVVVKPSVGRVQSVLSGLTQTLGRNLDYGRIVDAARALAKVKSTPASRQYVPRLENWLKGERWEEEVQKVELRPSGAYDPEADAERRERQRRQRDAEAARSGNDVSLLARHYGISEQEVRGE